LESLIPDSITFTDEQFKIFLEKTIITEHSRRIFGWIIDRTERRHARATGRRIGGE
jgi:hypothetical protein